VRRSPGCEEDVVAAKKEQFVQVIRGHVADGSQGRDEMRSMLDRWAVDLGPRAKGWLGSTAGVADDGTFVAMARFGSEEAARKNSARPEQNQWWMETSKLFTGDVSFLDCPRTEEFLRGGSDDAGFVQVIEGRVSDVARMRRLNERLSALTAAGRGRDDVIGGVVGLHSGDRFVQFIYFTTLQAARAGEAAQMSEEEAAIWEEEAELLSDLSYVDLTDPWTYAPR